MCLTHILLKELHVNKCLYIAKFKLSKLLINCTSHPRRTVLLFTAFKLTLTITNSIFINLDSFLRRIPDPKDDQYLGQ